MSKIYEALEKAKEEKHPKEVFDIVPVFQDEQPELKELFVLDNLDSPITESFRFLRSKITRPSSGDPPRSILISSALKGEGKTFVACNLAASISQGIEEYVLLIDADLRNPRVHKVFGIGSGKEGLSTYLDNKATLSALLRKTALNKLTVLPAGNSTSTPAELLSSERMRSLIREVKDRYPDRYIIIDSPPLEMTPEASVIANEVDAVILVVRHGKTPRDAVKAATGRVQKEKLLGIVYNGYDEPFKTYDRYGYYKYGYGSKKK
ncbi:MAG: polysaccharide biosynthesis tyrosine autokinase [Smithellaceae bacterium]